MQLQRELSAAKEEVGKAKKELQDYHYSYSCSDYLRLQQLAKLEQERDQLKKALASEQAARETLNRDFKFQIDEVAQLKQQLAEAGKDKERLDWIESNKVAINRLSERDEVLDFWHLYWPCTGHGQCSHFGKQDLALAPLRDCIDAIIAQQKK